jgi:hypothetical protein
MDRGGGRLAVGRDHPDRGPHGAGGAEQSIARAARLRAERARLVEAWTLEAPHGDQ